MTNNPNDIDYILEEYNKIINENPLSDLGASIGNKISNGVTNVKSALGSRKATGEQTRNNLANTMTDSWYNWLGETNGKGTVDDLREFLMLKVGFNSEEAQQLISNEFGENGNILNRDNQEEPSTNNNENDNDDVDISTPTDNEVDDEETVDTKNSANFTEENPPDNTPEEQKIIASADEITKNISAKARNNDMNTLDIVAVLNACKSTRKLVMKPSDNVSNLTRLYAVNKLLDGYAAVDTFNENNNILTPDQEDSLKATIAKTNTFVTKLKKYIDNHEDSKITNNDTVPDQQAAQPSPNINNNQQKTSVNDNHPISNDNQKNESINEDEILDNDTVIPKKTILKFFKDASAFAYKYNLVGKKRNKTPYGVPTSYSNNAPQNYSNTDTSSGSNYRGTGRNYVPQDENEKDEKRFNRRMDKTWDRAETLGLSTDDIQDVKALALDNKFQNINNKDDKDKLAAIGWSFLRSIR